jgi:hypothetical protein
MSFQLCEILMFFLCVSFQNWYNIVCITFILQICNMNWGIDDALPLEFFNCFVVFFTNLLKQVIFIFDMQPKCIIANSFAINLKVFVIKVESIPFILIHLSIHENPWMNECLQVFDNLVLSLWCWHHVHSQIYSFPSHHMLHKFTFDES